VKAVRLSTHAVERYVERVKPHLGYDEAFEELRALVKGGRGGPPPAWAPEAPVGEVWLHVSDGIALPLVATGTGWLAETVLIRGGVAGFTRERRNDRRKRRPFRTGSRAKRRDPVSRRVGRSVLGMAEDAWASESY
jgi:hypothetical protein